MAPPLPTPSTSHVNYDTVYEPAEDSFLFLDTLSSASESQWLKQRFDPAPAPPPSPAATTTTTTTTAAPLLVEVGTGSGVVLGFAAANAQSILGRRDVLALGTDLNLSACRAAAHTLTQAVLDQSPSEEQVYRASLYHEASADNNDNNNNHRRPPQPSLASTIMADLCAPIRRNSIDILLFNPPYVPTPDVPHAPGPDHVYATTSSSQDEQRSQKFDRSSYLLSLAYAGGDDGMQITNRLLDELPSLLAPGRGVAYFLFCKQNHPDEVKKEIVHGMRWQNDAETRWNAEIVGDSGLRAGREKLCIMRIWRD